MTEVTTGQDQEPAELSAADEQVLRELTERARTGGLKLTGEGGLLGRLTKMVAGGALEGELDDHLGYSKHDPAGRNGSNSRNGHRAKTMITETGPLELSVPRDRDSSFEPKIVAKRRLRLTGVDEPVTTVWEKTIVQTCIVHLLRNSFKYASKKDWAQVAKDLKPVYTAASEAEALDRFAEFSGKWEKRYPAIIRLWENAWPEFVPFLRSGREIRTVVCTTNAIESINARLRRAVNARGHFPTEQAALKCLYLAIMSLDPTGRGRQRWTNRWKAALNAFDITFDGRLSAGRN